MQAALAPEKGSEPGRGWSTGDAEVADSRKAALTTRLGTGPGRGWSTGDAEVADNRRGHRQPDRALDQDAVVDQSENGWRPVVGWFLVRKPVSVAE